MVSVGVMVKVFRRFIRKLKKNKRLRTIFFATTGTLLTVILIVTAAAILRAEDAKTFSIAVGEEFDTLDPAFCDSADCATVIACAFEGLMKYDEDGNVVPGQAVSYSVSEDGLKYTFTISPEARWSNDTPVTAADFIYAWNRASDDEINPRYAYLFDNIARTTESEMLKKDDDKKEDEQSETEETVEEEVVEEEVVEEEILYLEAEGKSTLVVHLEKADSAFLEKCAMPVFSPVCEEVATRQRQIWGYIHEVFVSNGPYVLTYWESGSYLTLGRNSEYPMEKKVKPEVIKVYFTEDENEAFSLFNKGSVDYTTHIPADKLEKASKDNDFQSKCEYGTYYIGFNQKIKPFDDKNVRLALSLAIDRSKITEAVGEQYAQEANSILSPAFTASDGEALNEKINTTFFASSTSYQTNVEKAKQLLSKAGYPGDSKFPTVEYIYNENEYHKKIAEIIVSCWKENLGINCVAKPLEWQKFDSDREGFNYTAVRCGAVSLCNDPASVLENFTTQNNFFGWSDEGFDEAVFSLEKATDITNRSTFAVRAQNILESESVVCPLYWYKRSYLVSDRLENYYVSPDGTAYFGSTIKK